MLCAAGVFFAAHSLPAERKAAVACALALLAACVAYNAAWWPSPHTWLGIRYTTYFSFVSVLAASYSFERSINYWWGLPLLTLYSLDICCHIARTFNEIDYYPYSVAVDFIGYLQIAIFVSIGGDGVRNRLANIVSRLRNGFSTHQTARYKESEAE